MPGGGNPVGVDRAVQCGLGLGDARGRQRGDGRACRGCQPDRGIHNDQPVVSACVAGPAVIELVVRIAGAVVAGGTVAKPHHLPASICRVGDHHIGIPEGGSGFIHHPGNAAVRRRRKGHRGAVAPHGGRNVAHGAVQQGIGRQGGYVGGCFREIGIIEGNAERINLDGVGAHKVIPDMGRIPTVVVPVGNIMVRNHEQPAAILHKLHHGGLFGGGKDNIGFAHHKHFIVRQILRVASISVCDLPIVGKGFHVVTLFYAFDPPGRNGAFPIGFGGGGGHGRLRRRGQLLRVGLSSLANHGGAIGKPKVMGIGINYPVGITRRFGFGGVKKDLDLAVPDLCKQDQEDEKEKVFHGLI